VNKVSNQSQSESGKKEINLKEYFDVIKRRIWIVVVFTIITTGAGYVYAKSNTHPVYQASTRIILGTTPDTISTLMVIIKDPAILSYVVKDLNLKEDPEALANQINVASLNNSQVVNIDVTASSPDLAAKIANSTAEVFKQRIVDILNFHNVTILSEAKVNPWPITGNHAKVVEVAIILGVILGIGLTFLLDSLDDTVRDEMEIEQVIGLPVVGSVSRIKKRNTEGKKKKNKVTWGEKIGAQLK
jgi:capsular polysaccharide biosynthesis protein